MHLRLFCLGSLLCALLGCASTSEPPSSAPAPSRAPAPQVTAPRSKPEGKRKAVRLLFTTDEHGWLGPLLDEDAGVLRGGVVALASRLTREEGLGNHHVALFSAGDMWTGPHETTALEGEPMVKAMNHLGYRAAVVGNHEFDFGLGALVRRHAEARFPFLGANLREAATGKLPVWAKPWVILDVGGVRFGVVGLSNIETPKLTDPRHLAGLEFLPYDDTLRRVVPAARAAGAEQILVLMHASEAEAEPFLPLFRELGVHVVGLGHAHSASLRIDPGPTPDDPRDDIVLCNGGAYLRSYCRVDLAFEGGALVERSVEVRKVESPVKAKEPSPDPVLVALVEEARRRSEEASGEVLVTAPRGVPRKGGALGQLVVESWLEALPYADAAITNAGGLRQDLPRGEVRLRDVLGAMPFQNYLLVVELTGAELKEALENPQAVAGGVRVRYRAKGEGRVVEELARADGTAIRPTDRLRVVINDFMYRGGDDFRFKAYDPEPEETALDWREPVLRRLRALAAAGRTLEGSFDEAARLRP